MLTTAVFLALLGQAASSTVSPPGPASQGDDRDAEELRNVANELFEAGRLEEAEAVLSAAYAIDPDPDLLFARGVVAKNLGDCDRAIELWNEYLETGPDAEGTRLAQMHLADCGEGGDEAGSSDPEGDGSDQEPGATAADAGAPPAPVVKPTTDPGLPRPLPDRRRWYRDPWGGALLGVGVVAAAIGGGLIGGAANRAASSGDAATERDFSRDVATGTQLNQAGIALVSIGSALVIGSVIRYAVVARRR